MFHVHQLAISHLMSTFIFFKIICSKHGSNTIICSKRHRPIINQILFKGLWKQSCANGCCYISINLTLLYAYVFLRLYSYPLLLQSSAKVGITEIRLDDLQAVIISLSNITQWYFACLFSGGIPLSAFVQIDPLLGSENIRLSGFKTFVMWLL